MVEERQPGPLLWTRVGMGFGEQDGLTPRLGCGGLAPGCSQLHWRCCVSGRQEPR